MNKKKKTTKRSKKKQEKYRPYSSERTKLFDVM